MASTHFTTGTTITSEWLNDVNDAVYEGNITAEGVQYTPPFTGGVTQTVEAKLAQTVSVKDFGAVGDGVTDDTAAIQAAIDSGAQTIFFPDGDYLCGGLTVPDNVYNIEGTGTLLANADSVTVMQVLTDISREHTKSISGGLRILGNGFSDVVGLHLGSVGPSTNPEAVLYMSIRDITIKDCQTGLYSNVSMEHVYENVVLVSNTIGMNFINDPTNGGNNANTFIGMRFNSNTVGVAVINTATGLPLHNNSFIGCTFQENTTCGAYVRTDGVALSPYIQNVSFYNSHFESNGTGTNVVIAGRTYQTCDIEAIRSQITVNGMDGGSSNVNFVKALQYSIINLVNVTGSPGANSEFVSNDGTCTIYENELVSASSSKSISSYGQLSGINDLRVVGSPFINIGLYRNDSTMANPVVPLINNSTGTLANGYVKDSNFGLVSYVQFNTVAGSTASNRNYWLAAPASAGTPFIISFYVKSSASSSFDIRTFNPGQYQTISKTLDTSWQRIVFAGTNTASGIGVYIYPNDTVGATLYFKGLQVINSSSISDINNVYQNGIVGAKTLNYEQLPAAPTQGTWAVGDTIWNSAPASGGYMGWVCTTAGTPGTWKTFGVIS